MSSMSSIRDSVSSSSHGFNYQTLACGKMRIDQWISAFGSDAPARERDEELEESFDVQWLPADACNPEECNVDQVCVDCSRCNAHCSCNKKHNDFVDSFRCDPRTCTASKVRVAVGLSSADMEQCNREKCNDIYFCEECSKCRKHCLCNVENNSQDVSICHSSTDAYMLSAGKKDVLYNLQKRDISWHSR
eukprot:scaffold8529_cov137-Cylindrotheca_fusiformis.AAC.10